MSSTALALLGGEKIRIFGTSSITYFVSIGWLAPGAKPPRNVPGWSGSAVRLSIEYSLRAAGLGHCATAV